MKKFFFLSLTLFLLPTLSFAQSTTAQMKFSEECILKAIAQKKNVTLRPEVSMPEIFLESQTPLQQYIDDLREQWGPWPNPSDEPTSISNAYAYMSGRNRVYLIDSLDYYQKEGRTMDDSLAHELVHFLQVKYQNDDLTVDEMAEMEAVDIQTWFRKTFMQGDSTSSPCP